jgi:hypothetical protein
MRLGILANDEKCRVDMVLGKNIEQLGRERFVGAVVERHGNGRTRDMDGAVGNRRNKIRCRCRRGRTRPRLYGWHRCLSGKRTGEGERYEREERKKPNEREIWNFHKVEICAST